MNGCEHKPEWIGERNGERFCKVCRATIYDTSAGQGIRETRPTYGRGSNGNSVRKSK